MRRMYSENQVEKVTQKVINNEKEAIKSLVFSFKITPEAATYSINIPEEIYTEINNFNLINLYIEDENDDIAYSGLISPNNGSFIGFNDTNDFENININNGVITRGSNAFLTLEYTITIKPIL